MTMIHTDGTRPHRIAYVVSQWRKLTETFVRREIDAARAAGCEVVVLSLRRPVLVAEEDPPVHWVHGPALVPAFLRSLVAHPIRASRALLAALRWSRPSTMPAHLYGVVQGVAAAGALPLVDWVHAHFAWVHATAADALARTRGIPFSVMPHAYDIFDESRIDQFLVRKLRRAAFVVVESDWISAEVWRRYGCRATTLRMGVPAERVRTGAVPPPSPAVPTILSVGALGAKKGHDVLLRALAMVPGAWRCEIVGEGPERPALEALATSLGLQGRVTLSGARPEEDVFRRLDEAAVFCLASRVTPSGDRDGVPNVLIEAMARGLPIVSTSVAGIPDLLGGGRGLLVGPESPAELAVALRRMLTDDELRTRAAQAARAHVLDHYTAERNWTRLAALMEGSRCSLGGAAVPAGRHRRTFGPARRIPG